jgi:hypothetical protein
MNMKLALLSVFLALPLLLPAQVVVSPAPETTVTLSGAGTISSYSILVSTGDPCALYGGKQLKDGTCQTTFDFHMGPDNSVCLLHFSLKLWHDPKVICTWTPNTSKGNTK